MNPAETVANMYGEDFGGVLAAHLLHGYVFSGPGYFVMGRAVSSNEPNPLDFGKVFTSAECDAWLITAMAGDVRTALQLFPYALPWALWQRRGKPLRKWRFSSLVHHAGHIRRAPRNPRMA